MRKGGGWWAEKGQQQFLSLWFAFFWFGEHQKNIQCIYVYIIHTIDICHMCVLGRERKNGKKYYKMIKWLSFSSRSMRYFYFFFTHMYTSKISYNRWTLFYPLLLKGHQQPRWIQPPSHNLIVMRVKCKTHAWHLWAGRHPQPPGGKQSVSSAKLAGRRY